MAPNSLMNTVSTPAIDENPTPNPAEVGTVCVGSATLRGRIAHVMDKALEQFGIDAQGLGSVEAENMQGYAANVTTELHGYTGANGVEDKIMQVLVASYPQEASAVLSKVQGVRSMYEQTKKDFGTATQGALREMVQSARQAMETTDDAIVETEEVVYAFLDDLAADFFMRGQDARTSVLESVADYTATVDPLLQELEMEVENTLSRSVENKGRLLEAASSTKRLRDGGRSLGFTSTGLENQITLLTKAIADVYGTAEKTLNSLPKVYSPLYKDMERVAKKDLKGVGSIPDKAKQFFNETLGTTDAEASQVLKDGLNALAKISGKAEREKDEINLKVDSLQKRMKASLTEATRSGGKSLRDFDEVLKPLTTYMTNAPSETVEEINRAKSELEDVIHMQKNKLNDIGTSFNENAKKQAGHHQNELKEAKDILAGLATASLHVIAEETSPMVSCVQGFRSIVSYK
jgi:hypothetical protein